MKCSWVLASLSGGVLCPASCRWPPTIAHGFAGDCCVPVARRRACRSPVSNGEGTSLVSQSHHHQLYSPRLYHLGVIIPSTVATRGRLWGMLAHGPLTDGPSPKQQHKDCKHQQIDEHQVPRRRRQQQRRQQQQQRTPDSDGTVVSHFSAGRNSGKGERDEPVQQRLPSHDAPCTCEKDDGADRLFAAARSLHLRRHRSRASRDKALSLFRETMRLRPRWKETDSRFAVESGIDDVFRSFSHENDFTQHRDTLSSGTFEENDRVDGVARDGGVRARGARRDPDRSSGSTSGARHCDDARYLRAGLARIGYTACKVQERFGVGSGRRLPGPYFLNKSFDHRNSAATTSMGEPNDALDVAIRLFLLGLALPRAQVELSLSRYFVEAADRLGMLGECPVDSSLLVSLVQLFPLDAEALLPPQPSALVTGTEEAAAAAAVAGTAAAERIGDYGVDIQSSLRHMNETNESLDNVSGMSRGSRTSSRSSDIRSSDRKKNSNSSSRSNGTEQAVSDGDGDFGSREGTPGTTGGPQRQADEKSKEPAAARGLKQTQEDVEQKRAQSAPQASVTFSSASASSSSTAETVAASDMIFATDWPPPGSTALAEEPVMYIGPDSIGLVQHAPRLRMSGSPAERPPPTSVARGVEAVATGAERYRGRGAHCCGAGGGGGREREDGARSELSPSAGAVTASTSAAASSPRAGGGRRRGGGKRGGGGRETLGGKEAAAETTPTESEAHWIGETEEGSGTGRRRHRRERAENILDLCSGSGVQGIAAAVLRRGKATVTCVDINPRAVRFSRFNAVLNGLDIGRGDRREDDIAGGNFRAVVGDLYGAVDADTAAQFAAFKEVQDVSPSLVGARRSEKRAGRRSITIAGSSVDSGVSSRRNTNSRDTSPVKISPSSAPVSPPCYDLILANPPFVPVPPRLGAVRRRYDVFASGGPSGEEVIEGIFRGAMGRLRPGSGVLAVVTELANPRTFDAKLRRWLVGGVGVDPVRADDGEERNNAASGSSSSGVKSCGFLDSVKEGEDHHSRGGDGGSRKPTREIAASLSAGTSAASAAAWSGVVLHERNPWTAREYALRRAGSSREVDGWERHLTEEGIEEMAAGFVFVRRCSGGPRRQQTSVTASMATGSTLGGLAPCEKHDVNGGYRSSSSATAARVTNEASGLSHVSPERVSSAARDSCVVQDKRSSVGLKDDAAGPVGGEEGKTGETNQACARGGRGNLGEGAFGPAKVEVHGVEKLWAPHNREALDFSSAAVRRMYLNEYE